MRITQSEADFCKGLSCVFFLLLVMDYDKSLTPQTGYNWTTEWLASSHDSSLLAKCLIWLEMFTAVTGFVINSLVMTSAKIYNASCRGYFFGLLNLALAQCLLSLTSFAGAISSLLVLDYDVISPFTYKENWWCFVLHNVIHAIHLLSIAGTAALSWTHWWSLNISANHIEMPTGYRVIQVVFCVLWLIALLFATWLNFLVAFWGTGLTTTVAENDRRAIQPCLRIYSLTLIGSACLLFFSNLTSIPPVTGHLTTRAIRNSHQQNCHDADCVCSDSKEDYTPKTCSPKILKPENEFCFKKVTLIPTIVTHNEFEHVTVNECTTHPPIDGSQLLCSSNHTSNLRLVSCESKQDFVSSLSIIGTISSPASHTCSMSMYSADISTNSVYDSIANSTMKLSVERLHQRLQQLSDSRPVSSPDQESRSPSQSSFPQSRATSKSRRKRQLKKRKPPTKLKKIKGIQWERPSSIQVTVMVSFMILYLPPWFLLLAGNYMPKHATMFLSIFRLLINVASVNPILQGFRHPRFALRMVRTWRKVYPASNFFQEPSNVIINPQNSNL